MALKGWAEFNELKKILGFTPIREEGQLEVLVFKKITLDTIKFDEQLGEHSKGRYDPKNCKLDGGLGTMESATKLLFGDRARELVEFLL